MHAVCFDHAHPCPSLNALWIHSPSPHPLLTSYFVFFLTPHWVQLMLLIYGWCEVFHRSMVDLPRTTPLKKTDPLGRHQLSYRCEDCESLSPGRLNGLISCRSCTGNLSCCEITGASVLSHLPQPQALPTFPTPLPQYCPRPGELCDIDAHLWQRGHPCSLHSHQLWVSLTVSHSSCSSEELWELH